MEGNAEAVQGVPVCSFCRACCCKVCSNKSSLVFFKSLYERTDSFSAGHLTHRHFQTSIITHKYQQLYLWTTNAASLSYSCLFHYDFADHLQHKQNAYLYVIHYIPNSILKLHYVYIRFPFNNCHQNTHPKSQGPEFSISSICCGTTDQQTPFLFNSRLKTLLLFRVLLGGHWAFRVVGNSIIMPVSDDPRHWVWFYSRSLPLEGKISLTNVANSVWKFLSGRF